MPAALFVWRSSYPLFVESPLVIRIAVLLLWRPIVLFSDRGRLAQVGYREGFSNWMIQFAMQFLKFDQFFFNPEPSWTPACLRMNFCCERAYVLAGRTRCVFKTEPYRKFCISYGIDCWCFYSLVMIIIRLLTGSSKYGLHTVWNPNSACIAHHTCQSEKCKFLLFQSTSLSKVACEN